MSSSGMTGVQFVFVASLAAACGGNGTLAEHRSANDANPVAEVHPSAHGHPSGSIAACGTSLRPPPSSFPVRADGLAPLSSVAVAAPAGGDLIDFDAAVRLGKIFFWDTQAGGDGQTACASCHFSAGADQRLLNTLSPGPNGIYESMGVTGPGEPAKRENTTGDDRVGSQGVVARVFTGIDPDPAQAADLCQELKDPPFLGYRQVTGRNAPTVIGAVFFRELFWDGRANHLFNGVDPFGQSANAGAAPRVTIEGGALASQAVGPANNPVEMSCSGRGFDGPNGLGAKLLARAPLANQQVAMTDGVLGCLSAAPQAGLRCDGGPCRYRDLIGAAFGAALAADAENQFARIWGQGIQAYESTLIPDQTPLDRFLAGDDSAISAPQKVGLKLFAETKANGGIGCINCHAGPELSDATVRFAAADTNLINVDGGDLGFHHLGVRSAGRHPEDAGRAGLGPLGKAFSRSGALADISAFKTPQLRNVKLTAPYFHNGGKATLKDVVAFYSSGGDFRGTASQFPAFILSPADQAALLDFLENALTDCRVEKSHAPFDHPSIAIPNGPLVPATGAEGDGACSL